MPMVAGRRRVKLRSGPDSLRAQCRSLTWTAQLQRRRAHEAAQTDNRESRPQQRSKEVVVAGMQTRRFVRAEAVGRQSRLAPLDDGSDERDAANAEQQRRRRQTADSRDSRRQAADGVVVVRESARSWSARRMQRDDLQRFGPGEWWTGFLWGRVSAAQRRQSKPDQPAGRWQRAWHGWQHCQHLSTLLDNQSRSSV
jgi:hypothetical protein